MDKFLINRFHEEVNDRDLVLQMYHNRDGKDQWSIICSAMDWIDVVVEEIDVCKLSRGNDNESSIRLMTFIMCIDVLWEAIQQLSRVFFGTGSIPFSDDNSIFEHKLFPTTDNAYFKTIRACFAAHPVNLNDRFGGTKEKEHWYASWSGGKFGEGDFSAFLYSNKPHERSILFSVQFNELIAFAQKRYNYLNDLIDEIRRQKEDYLDGWRHKEIPRSNDPLAQIEILVEEASRRFYSDEYYNYKLKKLQIIFSTTITLPKNKALVEKYQNAFKAEIEEIYENLQNMISDELRSEQSINDSCPPSCRYYFSKLCEIIYGNGYYPLDYVKCFQPYLHELAELSEDMPMDELYTVVCAGFFALNRLQLERV